LPEVLERALAAYKLRYEKRPRALPQSDAKRTIQFATRVTPAFDTELRAIAASHRLMLVQVIEHSIVAYEHYNPPPPPDWLVQYIRDNERTEGLSDPNDYSGLEVGNRYVAQGEFRSALTQYRQDAYDLARLVQRRDVDRKLIFDLVSVSFRLGLIQELPGERLSSLREGQALLKQLKRKQLLSPSIVDQLLADFSRAVSKNEAWGRIELDDDATQQRIAHALGFRLERNT